MKTDTSAKHIAIIGAGPAGLRAAEVAVTSGAKVTVYDAMRSVGRKFLVAGKSGLNLTNGAPIEDFFLKYQSPELPTKLWQNILSQFDNNDLRKWAHGLGIETFVASSGKVFPSPHQGSIKAAPLLRRWVERLRNLGVEFKTQHKWIGFDTLSNPIFQHLDTELSPQHDATILALGGGSWPQTGANGHWVKILDQAGIKTTPLTATNCGWEVAWPEEVITEAEGLPIKNAVVKAGDSESMGELIITRYGIEGAPIYRLGHILRHMTHPEISIDFKSSLNLPELTSRLGRVKKNYIREAKRRWKLDSATCSLLKHLPDRGPWTSAAQLASEVKSCRIPLTKPRPIAEAISSAGGVCWSEIDHNLMLKKIPAVFLAGEMINWEAPTGGYLLQACFATGTYAGKMAAKQN